MSHSTFPSPGPRSPRVLTHCARALCLIVAFVTPFGLGASSEDLPKAEVILERYIEATGGRPAYEKLENRVVKGTVEYVTLGATAEMTRYEAKPDKAHTIIQSDELGKMEEGVAGEVAWEITPMMGPRVKKGNERADAIRSVSFNGPACWRGRYKTVECVGTDSVDGKECYKVKLTPASGNAEIHYYDLVSGLILKMETILEHPNGSMNVEQYASDYKPVDGIRYAHKFRMLVGGQQIIVTVRAVVHNVDIPDDRLALPDEIQALSDQDKKPPPEGE